MISKKNISMIFIAFMVIAIGVLTGTNKSTSAQDTIDVATIKADLEQKGVPVSRISAQNKQLNVVIRSKGSGAITADDVLFQRAVLNEVRKNSYRVAIQQLSLGFEDNAGNMVSNGTTNGIQDVPTFQDTMPPDTVNLQTTTSTLHAALTMLQVQSSEITVAPGELGGEQATIYIDYPNKDLSGVNQLVSHIQAKVEELNRTGGTGIHQYTLTIQDQSKQPLVVLTADLKYRDWFWWQTPALGNGTWTGDSPR